VIFQVWGSADSAAPFFIARLAKQVLAPRLRRDLAAQRMRRDAAAGLAIGRRLDDPGA